METDGLDSPAAAADVRTKVLIAAGASPVDRRCVAGELVFVPPPCGRPRCSCADGFTGATTHGLTDLAEVGLIDDADRASVQRTLADAMCGDCVPGSAARSRAAAVLLDVAERLPLGTALRREAGTTVPVARPGRPTVGLPADGGAR